MLADAPQPTRVQSRRMSTNLRLGRRVLLHAPLRKQGRPRLPSRAHSPHPLLPAWTAVHVPTAVYPNALMPLPLGRDTPISSSTPSPGQPHPHTSAKKPVSSAHWPRQHHPDWPTPYTETKRATWLHPARTHTSFPRNPTEPATVPTTRNPTLQPSKGSSCGSHSLLTPAQ